MAKALRAPLLKQFPAALLGRLVVIPYYPLSTEMLANIARLQLERVVRRVREHHDIPFSYDDAAVKLIVSRCVEVESGGRMIDAILTNTVLPAVSREFLTRMLAGSPLAGHYPGRRRAATSPTDSSDARRHGGRGNDPDRAQLRGSAVARGRRC